MGLSKAVVARGLGPQSSEEVDQFMLEALEPLGVEVEKVSTPTLGLIIEPRRLGGGSELLIQG